jgi:hypothetical protein
MTTMEFINHAYRAEPFRPFALLLADGRWLDVPRRETLAFNPRGRVAVVLDENDGAEYVDLTTVQSVGFEGEPAATK